MGVRTHHRTAHMPLLVAAGSAIGCRSERLICASPGRLTSRSFCRVLAILRVGEKILRLRRAEGAYKRKVTLPVAKCCLLTGVRALHSTFGRCGGRSKKLGSLRRAQAACGLTSSSTDWPWAVRVDARSRSTPCRLRCAVALTARCSLRLVVDSFLILFSM